MTHRFPKQLWFVGIIFALPFLIGTTTPQALEVKPQAAPLSPAQERETFRIAPGYRLELVACEPQITSPVAMMFDEEGKLWVVEMRDYPNGPPKGQPPQGRILILRDLNRDGHYEHRSLFADKLLFANGLMRWRDGVIVTQAPNIVHLRDTDGDGKADKTEVLYKGFAEQNPQLRVSHPNLGVDNWVYVANGLRGGAVVRSGSGKAKPINLSGMDFRFNLIDGRHEAISGMGQFGNTIDDWGRRFVCDNRHHLRHVVLPNRYLKNNPFLAVRQVLDDISVLEDGPLSSGGKVYPLSKNWTTSNLHAGRFTAACGVYIYRSGLLPDLYGSALTCDPTGNLVHREILKARGASFTARPARKGVEFLASPHDWFRPVFLTDGPDGALYVVDMYRAVIEHPQFMPPELKNRPDLTKGINHGRIWRIVPEKHDTKANLPKFDKLTNKELVAWLNHANAWQRNTAQRLLLQRRDKLSVPMLRKLCTSKKDARGRLLAMWLLQSFDELDEKMLAMMLHDLSPRMREHAVLIAEAKLAKSPALRERVLKLANDYDDRVRFQVALSLGDWNDDRKIAPLAEILKRGIDDEWTRQAVYSAVPKRAGQLLSAWLTPPTTLTKLNKSRRETVLQELTSLVGSRRDVAEIAGVIQSLQQLSDKDAANWQLIGLDGLANGLQRRGGRLNTIMVTLAKTEPTLAKQTTELLARSAAVAQDTKRPLAVRQTGVRLLSQISWQTAKPTLLQLMKKDQPGEIRLAAIRSLAAHAEPDVAPLLLKSWRAYTPAVRGAALNALLQRQERVAALLAEVKSGRVKPGDIDAVSMRRLLSYRNAKIRAEANRLLKNNLPAERKQVLAKYQLALKQEGDPRRGIKVFEKNCATCHRIGKIGVDVGPAISDTRTKTPATLLNNILNPNQAIDNNFINYLVVLKNGKVVNGVIDSETASSITLRRASNEKDVVFRRDIDEIASSGVSLMPEGLEKNISVNEMADLLSYLKNWRYLDGNVPMR